MAAYFIMSQEVDSVENNIQNVLIDDVIPCAVSAQRIEMMRAKFRTHRAAFDFDTAFCKCEIVLVPVKSEYDASKMQL